MKKKIISALLTASLMLGMSYQSVIASENQISEIYVALDGDDSNPGTKDAPLKTPEAARDKIRTLKANGELGKKGAVVYFREGIYPFSEAFTLGKEDSGTEGAPITYRAYMEENVSFIGGFDLKPEDFEKVTDPKITGRLVEESARDKLYMLDLKKYGIREVPIPRLIGTYSYWRAAGVATEGDSVIMKQLVEELGYMEDSAATPELFIDDEIMTVAKYPNGEGEYLRTGVIIEAGPFMRNWNDDIIGSANWIPPEERIPTPFSFKTNEVINRLPYWKNANQAIMWGRWWYEWATQSVPLESVDPDTGIIQSAVPSAFSVQVDRPWYIYNLLEEIDAPGEYFLDRDTNRLYIIPPTDPEFMMSAVLTMLDGNIVEMNGVSYLNFHGIDVGRSRKGAFNIVNANEVHVTDSEISWTAGRAAMISTSKNTTFKHCYFHDVDGGIIFKDCGDKENLIKGNCGVENTEFENFERISGNYTTAASIDNGCGNFIRSCEIHDGVHMAVGFSGPYQEVSFNDMYDLCQQADDSGVVYTGRSIPTHWGSVVKNNYIHDCTPRADTNFTVGTIAVYLDDFLSGVTVTGNIIADMQLGTMFSGYNNTITNNIYMNLDTESIVTAFSASPAASSFLPTFQSQLNNATYRHNEAWSKAFPALAELTPEIMAKDVVSRGIIVANNYFWNAPSPNLTGTVPMHEENIVADNVNSSKDPGFIDADSDFYQLKEDAHIYEVLPDFQPIPFTRIGMYSERAMERISNAITLVIDSPYVFLNGEKKAINEDELDQRPVIINNSTYVPFRFLGEALGTIVEYDDATRTASFKNPAYDITFSLDNLDKVTKNSEEITLEVPMKVINGRTYMPLRSISEMLDKKVFWDDCGFITVSDTENLFNSEADDGLIDYLHGKLSIY